MTYLVRYLDILTKTFTSSVVMVNAIKTPMSSDSEAALLALAGDPRGLLVVIGCPKADEAVLRL